jgi:ligand-binding sensor domain-containing protein/two-component sensor histidine kinase
VSPLRHRRPNVLAGGFNACVSLWLSLLFLFLTSYSAWAVSPRDHLSQYAHTSWRIQDGFFRSTPTSIAQSKDGYLWIGTHSGLLRFDGIRFVPWSSEHKESLPSSEVRTLLGTSDGSLWIGTLAGLSRWKDQKLTNYANCTDLVSSILEDDKGIIWLTRTPFHERSAPLCSVSDTELHCYGEADGVAPVNVAVPLAKDREGNFWIGGDTTLLRWRAGSGSTYLPAGLKANAGFHGILGLAVTRDGTLWVGIIKTGRGLGLQQLVHGQWKSFATPDIDSSALEVTALFVDREDALWIGTDNRGIYRIHGREVDHFDSRDGLSGDDVWSLYEDHEGNLWVATSKGVDRFSETPVISFSKREGLAGSELNSVLASREGSVWVGGSALHVLRNGTFSSLRAGKELPGNSVTSLLEDHAGRLWIGIENTLWIYQDGAFKRVIKRRDGSPMGLVVGIAEDEEGSVWVEVTGPPRTLIRIQDMVGREEYPEPQMPAARRVAADPTGGIWLGLTNGDLAHYQNGKLATYRFVHNGAVMVTQLLPNPDGSVLAATTYGVIGWQKENLLYLTERNGLPCNEVYAMTLDDRENLWLFTACGLAEIRSAELQRWWRDPNIKMSIRTLDELDGVRPGRAAFVGRAARSIDGQLWFVNGSSLQMIDPAQLSHNVVPPPVHIEGIMADRKSYPPTQGTRLPPLTRSLQIDYTALSLTLPQRVRFRYRLEGQDKDWQEPGTRRQAFYNDLRPRKYRFHVIACNNDGVWNDIGATLDFSVAPAWYQTNWFLLLSVLTGTLLVWALYRVRVRQIARILSVRFDERLAERTRMARELHDTFLQTIQGSKLVAEHALKSTDDRLRMVRALEQLADWLGRATEEGRAALNSLRISTTQRNDLADALRRATEECRTQSPMEVSFSVVGGAKEMHPVVRDEVYRIGYEAIRNACTHSRASRLDVSLSYEHDLSIRVSDNGVGIDPTIVDRGKNGHFGLPGMRERAARIGGKLTIASSANSGTEITVVVPAGIVFTNSNHSQFERLHSILKRMSGAPNSR